MTGRILGVLILVVVLCVGMTTVFWMPARVSASQEGSAPQWAQALDEKLDKVLKNQEAILKQLVRIWKYK